KTNEVLRDEWILALSASSASGASSSVIPERDGDFLLSSPESPQVLPERVEPSSTTTEEEEESDHVTNSGPTYDPRWDRFAIAVKTGRDVIDKRLPIQLATFLSHARNVLILSDSNDRSEMNGIPVFNALNINRTLHNTNTNNGRADTSTQQPDSNAPGDMQEITPDTDSEGWRLDANKNLPGFRALFNHFPNAEWYIMIDDDSYLFLDNLDELLSPYDPSTPHYIGRANVFKGCDGVTEMGKGPFFAHGGSGIVLSRGSLTRMVAPFTSSTGGDYQDHISTCIKKYNDCWAGDIRVSLCLRDLGILLTTFTSFNGGSPNNNYAFPRDPCDRPVTFHHLPPNQISALWEVDDASKPLATTPEHLDREQKHRIMMGTNFGGIFEKFRNRFGWWGEYEPNTDRPGSDFGSIATESSSECSAV
ncbi:hypothetical protein HK102_010825, partial [Quaeritorhiza haematococci]